MYKIKGAIPCDVITDFESRGKINRMWRSSHIDPMRFNPPERFKIPTKAGLHSKARINQVHILPLLVQLPCQVDNMASNAASACFDDEQYFPSGYFHHN